MRIKLILFTIALLLIAGCYRNLQGQAIQFQSGSTQQQNPQFGDECASNADCPTGQACVDSVCGTFQEASQQVTLSSCTTNADCGEQVCINGACGKIETINYQLQACTAACKIKRVVIATSDDETYDFVPGKGSYTAAGALEWRIVAAPNHCVGQAKVPVLVTRRQYGKVLNEEYVTLVEDVPSKVLKHPSVTTLAFTLTADFIDEECS